MKYPILYSYDLPAFNDTTLAIQYPDGKVEFFLDDEWVESAFSYNVNDTLDWVCPGFEMIGDIE